MYTDLNLYIQVFIVDGGYMGCVQIKREDKYFLSSETTDIHPTRDGVINAGIELAKRTRPDLAPIIDNIVIEQQDLTNGLLGGL